MSFDPNEEQDSVVCPLCREVAMGTDEETGEDIPNIEIDSIFVCIDCEKPVTAVSLFEIKADEYHAAMEDRYDAMRDDIRGRHQ